MKQHIVRLVSSLLVFCLVWTSVHARYDKIPPPSEDEFYIPSAGFENEKPGTLLKSRALSHRSFSALSAFPQDLEYIYQFLYRTTDGLGAPIATVTTLLIPYNADLTKLVSYQIAEDSTTIDCAPSYNLQTGSTSSDYFIQAEPLLLVSLFRRGWCVSVPDYEGPQAAFGIGALAGKATLDGIRAVLSSGFMDPLAKVQMWGYSGGSIPVGWATQLLPSYAPELGNNIIGAVLGGVVVSPNATINHIRHRSFSTSMVMLFYQGFSNQHRDLADYIKSIIKVDKHKAYEKMNKMCSTHLLMKYVWQDLDRFLTRRDFANHPLLDKVLEENVMGRMDVPTIPLLIYHTQSDMLVPFPPLKEMVSNWCDGGANIQLVKAPGFAHSTYAIFGAPNAVLFLEDRFNNKPLQSGCSSITTSASIFQRHAPSVFGSMVWQALKALHGNPLGKRPH
ncbi:secretory lipase-domain-containing protein [Chlamydoabsidia padenii]|nr:secretory lipase-domain-containing protein [Chlamydoabsidia padenii]